VWLNRPRQRTALAFDAMAWKANARPGQKIPDGALVVLSFDGSRGSVDPNRSPDHTGLVATEIATGHQVKLGHWDPDKYPGRMIPRDLVNIAVDDAFTRFVVWRMYCDPPGWDSEIAGWKAQYGELQQLLRVGGRAERVVEWFTWRERAIAFACANYATAIEQGDVTNDGDPAFAAHIGAAHKRYVNVRDDKGNRLWTIAKERPGSPIKIDLAMCGVLGWEARSDAIAAGAIAETAEFHSVYEERGALAWV
jgi:hypothetical protein